LETCTLKNNEIIEQKEYLKILDLSKNKIQHIRIKLSEQDKSIQCEDSLHYCPDTYSCCVKKNNDDDSQSYGCCPVENAGI
jgi:hypothetical protein